MGSPPFSLRRGWRPAQISAAPASISYSILPVFLPAVIHCACPFLHLVVNFPSGDKKRRREFRRRIRYAGRTCFAISAGSGREVCGRYARKSETGMTEVMPVSEMRNIALLRACCERGGKSVILLLISAEEAADGEQHERRDGEVIDRQCGRPCAFR